MRFPTSGWLAVAFLLATLAPAHAQITPGGGVQLRNAGSPIGHTNTLNCATGCTFSLVGGIGNLTITGGGGSGTVTQVNTTSPIIGGPITTTGTISILDFVASGASHARGAVPDPGATPGTTKFLREDATWQVPTGSVSGTGTTHMIPQWTNGPGGVLGDSLSYYDAGSAGLDPAAGNAFIGDPGSNVFLTTNITGTGATLSTQALIGAFNGIGSTAQVIAAAFDASTPSANGLVRVIARTNGGTTSNYDFTAAGYPTTNDANAFFSSAGSASLGSLGHPWTLTNTKELNVPEMSAPALSASGFGTLYVDSTTHKFMVSNNGGAYSALGGGTVTSIATTSPITGGTITSTGTIACATCVTSASSLTSTAVMTGGGSQASQTPSATTTLDASGNLALAGGLTVTTRTGTPATMAVFTSGGVLAETTLPAAGVTSVTGTANQITSSPTTGAVVLSLPSAVTLPGSLTVTTRTGTPATMAVFTSGGVLAETTLPVSGVTSATGTANQIAVSASTGAVTWSLPSAVTMPGSLTVTTRTGTPATMAVFTSGGVLAETTLPTSGTVTSIATTSPITGGTITTTGTIACATCVTSAASLTSTAVMTGAGSQASQTPSATSTLDASGNMSLAGGLTVTGLGGGGTQMVTASNTGVLGVQAIPGTTTALTYSNCPPGFPCAVSNAIVVNSLTSRVVTLHSLPFQIAATQIMVGFGTATTPGTMRVCGYSESGVTKLFDTTLTPVASSWVTATISATLGPGNIYIAAGCATTCNVQALSTINPSNQINTTSNPTGKPIWNGTVTHASGGCDSSLGTITGATTAPMQILINH